MDEILGHVAHELDWLDPPPVFVGGAIVHLYLIASSQLQRATPGGDLIAREARLRRTLSALAAP